MRPQNASGNVLSISRTKVRCLSGEACSVIQRLESRCLLTTVVMPYGPDVTTMVPTSGLRFAQSAVVGQASAHLTIVPTFDITITNDPNAATIESTINSAIQNYANAFSDPVTVAITFKKSSSGLGSSSTATTTVSYSAFRSALASHATSSDDATALANLAGGSANPVNGSQTVALALPEARALGFSAFSGNDGTIQLNTSICNLTRSNISSSKFDLLSVAEHEIDEVLGIGSTLSGLSNGAASPTGAIAPEDLFRYDGSGNRSFTTSLSSVSYFSLDGTTHIAQFNQDATGDFNDWFSKGSHTPQVQDAFATAGATPDPGTELRALDVLGYSRAGAHPSPVAANDSATTHENMSVLVSELSNDTASGGATIDPSTVQIVTSPGHGSASVNAVTGQITYTPSGNFFGADSFTYRVNDSQGSTSNAATVSIAVHQNPTANNDAATINQNSNVVIHELANDTAAGGATLDATTVQVVTAPAHGSASVNASTGEITYTPAQNFAGVDGFTYTVSDSQGAGSNTAAVAITVHQEPNASNHSVTTNENSSVVVQSLSGASAFGGAALDPSSVQIGTAPAHGITSINTVSGDITFTPASNCFGPDSFTYTVKDNAGAVSAPATVNIQVHESPLASNDSVTTTINSPVLISEVAKDTAFDGAALDPTTVQISTAALHGIANIDPATGNITYTPASNYTGPDSFTYQLKDSTGAFSNLATVLLTINPVHQPPVAGDDVASAQENSAVTLNELSNDAASGGASIDLTSVKIATSPAHGTVSVNGSSGAITYTPAANFVGADSFTYTVKDTLGANSNPATVSVTVSQVVHHLPPVASGDSVTTPENTSVIINELGNDTASAGLSLNPASVQIQARPAHGTIRIDADTGQITYSPAASYAGPDTFTYRVQDGAGGSSNIATVSIKVVRPIATPLRKIKAHGIAIRGVEGSPVVNATIASFTAGAGETEGNFIATVNFGDGTSAPGIIKSAAGHFAVVAPQHVYAVKGRYPIEITLADSNVEVAPVQLKSSASIAAARLSGVANSFTAMLGINSIVSLGSVADADPDGLLPLAGGGSMFRGTISWGDGSRSIATLAQDPVSHTFAVSGGHRYARSGLFHIHALIQERGGKSITLVSVGPVA